MRTALADAAVASDEAAAAEASAADSRAAGPESAAWVPARCPSKGLGREDASRSREGSETTATALPPTVMLFRWVFILLSLPLSFSFSSARQPKERKKKALHPGKRKKC